MALFNFGKKKAPAPQQNKVEPVLLWSKTFTQSNSFKGYRRISLSTYNREGVSDTLSYFHDLGNNFKGRTIRLDNIRIPEVFTDGDAFMINVYVDNKPIGTVFGTNEQKFPDADRVRIRQGTYKG